MRNPLAKRLPRELVSEWKKYVVIFLFLALTIGFVSGIDITNSSMLKTQDAAPAKYALEDGHFVLEEKMTSDLKKEIEKKDVTLYDNFYKDLKETNGSKRKGTIRVYRMQKAVNRASVISGRMPEKPGEIAIDRMHADNRGIRTGDIIRAGNEKLKVCGLIAFVNYSTLYEKNTDSMFDALSFDVGAVVPETFSRLDASTIWDYAWKYDRAPKDESKEKKKADSLMKTAAAASEYSGNTLSDFIPRYANRAVQFAKDDMGSDKTMCNYLLYILVAVLAFIFAVTISSTIEKEASVIGTLRASGYTRGELIRHYMTAPVIVTAAAAVCGNILGYTFFIGVVENMYYNSYSLPAYRMSWNGEAFITTTVIPVIMMLVINFAVLSKKMGHPVQDFLRKDLQRSKKKKTVKLTGLGFIKRFRIRIFLQNLSNYVIMFIGIFFVMVMMVFAAAMPKTVDNYQTVAVDNMFVKHQYILKSTVDESGREIYTKTGGAEKFSERSLETKGGVHKGEAVTVYGIRKDSRYVDLPSDMGKKDVVISSAYSEKFGLEKGDRIKLKEKYENKDYVFKVAAVTDYLGGVCVFMKDHAYNKVFEMQSGAWNGFLSDREITDIPNRYIASEISKDDITKISRQLNHSMGSYMKYYQIICIIFAAILIYLLTKTIIERNRTSISMVKILGYSSREIGYLYMSVTAIVVLLWELIGMTAANILVKAIWKAFIDTMDGWIPYTMTFGSLIMVYAEVFAAYLVISIFDFRRISRIPMDEALKNTD